MQDRKLEVTQVVSTVKNGRKLNLSSPPDQAKVLCIVRHRGVQLTLAYNWAKPAILVAGKGRGGMFLFLLFLHFHSCSSFFPVPLFHLFYFLFSFLPFSGRRHKMAHKVDMSLNPIDQTAPLNWS